MAKVHTLPDGERLVTSEIVGGVPYEEGHRWAAFVGQWGAPEVYYGPDEETVLAAARASHEAT